MNCKQSLLGVGRFYTAEEALTFLTNMTDFEDESTSESENEGDSSDSSEYAPEQQYQVRTNSNIQTVLPNETVNQNTTKRALLADWLIKQPPHRVRNMLLHLQKYLKPMKYLKRAKKMHQNWLLIRMPQSMLNWLMKQPPHQVRNMLLHLQIVSKAKEIPKKGQKKSCTKTSC